MLEMDIFSVFDLKAEMFGQPFFAPNPAVAMRQFKAACDDRETPVGRNPEDFVLFRVGKWNSSNGFIAGCDAPVTVWTGREAAKGVSR